MSEEKKVTSSILEPSQPVKRKRGRPRKDESLKRGRRPAREVPNSEPVKRNPSRSTNLSSTRDDAFLGHAVTGVLDGSFDAGYLVSVKVDGTNTVLRGVLFEPGLVHPISEANDVASNVRMLKKNENPSPVPTQFHVSTQQSEGKKEHVQKVLAPLPLTVLPPAPEVKQMSPSKSGPCSPVTSKKVSIDINQVPQVSPQALQQEEALIASSGQLLSGGQANDASQVVHSSYLSTCSRKSLDKELQNNAIASLTEESQDGDEINVLRQGQEPGLSKLSFQDNGKVRHQMGFQQEETIDGTFRGQAVDLNDTPVIAASDVAADFLPKDKAVENQLITELSKMWGENHNQTKCDFPIIGKASHLNDKPEVLHMTHREYESKLKSDQLVGSSSIKSRNEGTGNQ